MKLINFDFPFFQNYRKTPTIKLANIPTQVVGIAQVEMISTALP